MNVTKKRGRPKKFNKNNALDRAMKVFWKKGYNGASMTDLTKAMSMNGPSIYAAFGNKQELYLKSIEAYLSSDECEPLVAFEKEGDIYKAVRAFFKAAIDKATDKNSEAKGCFLSSCVATTSGEIEGVQEILSDAIKQTDKQITARFKAEVAAGNLREDFPSMERAKLMFDLRQGIVFRARSGIGSSSINSNLDERVTAVLT